MAIMVKINIYDQTGSYIIKASTALLFFYFPSSVRKSSLLLAGGGPHQSKIHFYPKSLSHKYPSHLHPSPNHPLFSPAEAFSTFFFFFFLFLSLYSTRTSKTLRIERQTVSFFNFSAKPQKKGFFIFFYFFILQDRLG